MTERSCCDQDFDLILFRLLHIVTPDNGNAQGVYRGGVNLYEVLDGCSDGCPDVM